MRIRQLDGIRALAILLVFAEHSFGLKMGWTGVDLFFVLSGLLITRILRQDRDTPRYWSRFYLKRAARILPPLFVLFLVCSFFPLRRALWWAFIFFASNFVRVFFTGIHNPIVITWSLAIEEQFYLLWPFAVRFLTTRQLIRLLIAILIMEPLLRGITAPFTHDYSTIYYLTPFRIDGLALGSLIALLLENEPAKSRITLWAAPMFFVSMACLVGGMWIFPSFRRPANSIVFNSLGYTVVTLASASLICYTLLHEKAIVTKILSLRGLTVLGTISYGIYLYHGIFIWGFTVQGHPLASGLLAFAAVTVYCWLSFRFYEQPVIRWAHKVVKEQLPSRVQLPSSQNLPVIGRLIEPARPTPGIAPLPSE
jgi:peptidoglycan/LPS O-acetylase OafA/YrhL